MYATFRVQKLKSMAEVCGAGAHCTRSTQPPNADPDRKELNVILGGDPAEQIRTRIDVLRDAGVKWRSDAVRAIELVVGASPSFWSRDGQAHAGEPEAWDMEKVAAFEAHLVTWAEQEFGKDNVVSITRHMDETSPHWHVFTIPLDTTPAKERPAKTEPTRPGRRPRKSWEARLNAKRWLGGPQLISALQTRYADALEPLGLERGRGGARVSYQTVQQFHATLGELAPEIAQLQDVQDMRAALDKVIEADLGGLRKTQQMAQLAALKLLEQFEGTFLNVAQSTTKKKLTAVVEQLREEMGRGGLQPPAKPTIGKSRTD